MQEQLPREGLLGPSLGVALRTALRAFGSAPDAARRTLGFSFYFNGFQRRRVQIASITKP